MRIFNIYVIETDDSLVAGEVAAANVPACNADEAITSTARRLNCASDILEAVEVGAA